MRKLILLRDKKKYVSNFYISLSFPFFLSFSLFFVTWSITRSKILISGAALLNSQNLDSTFSTCLSFYCVRSIENILNCMGSFLKGYIIQNMIQYNPITTIQKHESYQFLNCAITRLNCNTSLPPPQKKKKLLSLFCYYCAFKWHNFGCG